MDSVTFFGAEAEGPDEEQAAPRGMCRSATRRTPPSSHSLQREGRRGKSPSMVGCYLPKGEKLACRAVDLLCD